ncbi:MAG TPA: hypothetical protein DHU55_08135 [Blastocatellia bacterium]|jgi:uncharacterized membrane protein|nr:hypothetical protein [Blastocatellia bacterium]HAF23644.1 hypothetical protein [Blastocatellia bacterium]HCX29726.1 hypothetical protein [Blastocatellia bacterium]
MQNPPAGQGYGSGTGNPQTGASRPAAGGLDPKIAAAISYLWIVGLILYFMEKENRFVRFHAMQSILFGIVNMIIMTVLIILAVILTIVFGVGGAAIGGGASAIGTLLVFLIWIIVALIVLVFVIGVVLAAVKAFQGKTFKLPIIGNMAEKIVNK